MSLILAPGVRLEQRSNGRIWEVLSEASRDSYDRGRRWNIRLIQRGSNDDRDIGTTSTSTARWLTDHCIIHPQVIPGPIGDGMQFCRIIADGATVMEQHFTSAVEACEWLDENLYPEQIGHWYGWDPTPNGPFIHDGGETPDMTCLSVDGALVWAES